MAQPPFRTTFKSSSQGGNTVINTTFTRSPCGPAPLSPSSAIRRQRVLDTLQERIRAIERNASLASALPDPEQKTSPAWSLGVAEVDALLGPAGLDAVGVHEVKPGIPGKSSGWAPAWATAFAFSLALSARRSAPGAAASGPILFCWPAAVMGELGRIYGPGLDAFGMGASCLIIVETAHAADALWAIEESLKSTSMSLVLGVLDEIALTPARRLALAAAAHRTPCLLLTHPRAGPAAATATRWRVNPVPGAPHRFDARAPGARGFSVDLERCRSRPVAQARSFCLEWCDEALCFRLAPGLADRADAPRRSGRRAG
jgi:protein ImuA